MTQGRGICPNPCWADLDPNQRTVELIQELPGAGAGNSKAKL